MTLAQVVGESSPQLGPFEQQWKRVEWVVSQKVKSKERNETKKHVWTSCNPWRCQVVSQPHFEKSVRMKFTFLKWGLGSPLGLPKLQSSIVGVKTPCIGAFFISLENYSNLDVENGLA